MTTSIRQFNASLFQEHVEEASFLYDQRRAYLHDPEVNWPDLADWEDRLEAHIDALVLGGELALEVCREIAADADAGTLHVALRMLSRHDRCEEALERLTAVDAANDELLHAAGEALCRDMPTRWQGEVFRALHNDHFKSVAGTLAKVVGYRRLPVEEILHRTLHERPTIGRAEIAWALGRIGTSKSTALLRAFADDPDSSVREAVAIALLRLGDDRALNVVVAEAPEQRWARGVLALAGVQDAVPVLLDALDNDKANAYDVIALGLLGDLSAVAPLLELLENEELAHAAAVALNTITGAALNAVIFVPDKEDLDALSDEERVAYEKNGILPTRAGRPYGNWERRPVCDKAAWHSWLHQNSHRFSRRYRWRMGLPHGPSAVLEALRSPSSPYAVRAAAYEELVIGFGLDVPFEVDLPVAQQLRFLLNVQAWVAEKSNLFAAGGWYRARDLG